MPAVPVNETVPRRSSVLAIVLAAGVMLPLAGCSSAPEDDEPAGLSGASAQDAPATERDQVAYGGTVRWAVDSPPVTLNAFQTEANPATDRVAGATLPALFTLDSEGKPQSNGDYLESAEVTGTEPRQTVVYKLNPKARWSDGRPIGVRDFKAQWHALNGKNKAYWSARNAGYDRIGQVSKGPGAHEVKVTFARPYADWKSLFTPLYPESVMAKPAAFNDKARTSLPASAGPFRVQSAPQGRAGSSGKSLSLERNPAWWGDKAKLDRIQLRAVPPGERGAALGRGQLDLAEIDTSAAKRITAAHSKRAKKKKGEKRGAPAGGPLGPAEAQGAAPMHPAASSMRDWAEAHMSKTALKQAEKEDKARRLAASKAVHEARAKQRARAAENRQLRGYTVRKALGTAYTQLAMNGESGPLRDERVRRAVARAIDRPKLAQQALGKLGLPAKPLGSHLMMPDQAGYSDQSAALGGADVQAAQQLLADSGWRGQGSSGQGADAKPQHGPAEGKQPSSAQNNEPQDNKAQSQNEGQQNGKVESAGRNAADTSGSSDKDADGKDGGKHAEAGEAGGGHKSAGVPVRMKGGQPLTLRFVLPSGPGSEDARATGARISRTLAGLGIATKVKKVAGESYFKDHVASGDYDLALFSWPASAYPATDGRPIFAKPQPAPDGSLQVEQNYTRVGTDQIDQLFDRASGELDEESRDEFLQRADARIWAAAGSVPLYQKPELAAARDRLVNAGAFGFRTPRYQDIGYQKD